jgi:flagellar hook-associated protein 3 FlgL
MSIASINYSSSVLGQSIQNIDNQLTNLSTELSTGVKAQNYAGMGVDEGFAIAARSQLSNITAFGDTMNNVNTIINSANTVLQSLSATVGNMQSAAAATPQNLTSNGQTIGQQNAASQLSSLIGMLNTQVGNRYIFSGSAISTPAVASASDIINGTSTKAGLTQVMAQRLQADLGTNGMGRLAVTSTALPSAPASMTGTQVAEEVAGSPFGLKVASVTSTLTGATVNGQSGSSGVISPSGSPAAFNVDFTSATLNPGDQITFTFNEPDGTQDPITLTATNTSPPPTGSFLIGSSATATAANFNSALTSSIQTLAATSLTAASAVEAGDNFFNTDGSAIGAPATNQQTPTAAAITAATALSGAAGSDSIANGFANGDTMTVDGTVINFSNTAPTGGNATVGYTVNTGDSIGALLKTIDTITGTSTPSTVHGGVITINTDNASTLSISSSNPTALASLGFTTTPTSPVTAAQPPLRVATTPLGAAVKLVNGSANTVQWYTGNSGPGSARASSTVRVDSSQTVDFGAQANEQAIRTALQNIAVYAASSTPISNANSPAEVAALSERIAANLTPQANQQTIQDIQTDFATAQNTMQAVQARQTQQQTALQNLVSNTEGISQDQVASELLQLQNQLSASFQTTSMLAQLSLTKYLPAGG